jgi:hypothetical protein
MTTQTLALLSGAILVGALSACTGGSDDSTSSPGNKSAGSSGANSGGTSGASAGSNSGADSGTTSGSASGATSGGPSGPSASLGPNCVAFMECCEKVADSQAATKQACDQAKTELESRQKSGESPSSLESECKQAFDLLQQNNLCN